MKEPDRKPHKTLPATPQAGGSPPGLGPGLERPEPGGGGGSGWGVGVSVQRFSCHWPGVGITGGSRGGQFGRREEGAGGARRVQSPPGTGRDDGPGRGWKPRRVFSFGGEESPYLLDFLPLGLDQALGLLAAAGPGPQDRVAQAAPERVEVKAERGAPLLGALPAAAASAAGHRGLLPRPGGLGPPRPPLPPPGAGEAAGVLRPRGRRGGGRVGG